MGQLAELPGNSVCYRQYAQNALKIVNVNSLSESAILHSPGAIAPKDFKVSC